MAAVRIWDRPVVGLTVVVLALTTAGCSLMPSQASEGTMPPAGPNGDIDPARAPHFIAAAGRDGGIAGYLPKRYLFHEPTTVPVVHW